MHSLIRVFMINSDRHGYSSRQEALRGRSERSIMIETGVGLALAVLAFIGTLIVGILTAVLIVGIIFVLIALFVGFMLRVSFLQALRILTFQNKKRN